MWITKDNIEIQRTLTTNLPMRVMQKESMILVDTGRRKACKSLMKVLSESAQNKDFRLVVLTHSHDDHIESLESLMEVWDVKVLIHRSEAVKITELVKANRIIEFDETFSLKPYGINGEVIHTPGHSAGSASVILNDEIALIGDHIGDFFTKPWAKNKKIVSASSLKSMERLLELTCTSYIPAHKKNWFTFNQLNIMYQQYIAGEALYEKQVSCSY